MTNEQLLQAIRTWLKAGAVAPATTTLADAQVILGDQDGPRPPLPYLSVKIITPQIQVGTDELVSYDNGDGDVSYRVRGDRELVVSVSGYGPGALDWLENAGLTIQLPQIDAILGDAGIRVDNVGGTTNTSTALDTSIEVRYTRTWLVRYTLLSNRDVAPPAEVIEVTTTTSGDLVQTSIFQVG